MTETLTTRRLFIGNISSQLFDTPEDITSRISRFGKLSSSFEGHFNEVRGTGFGYLNVEIDDKQYAKLKASLNGAKFKGSTLVIDVAKDDFEKRGEVDRARPGDKQEARLLKNQWEHYKKLENIKMSFKDRQEIIKGRERKSRRKGIKSMTLRVNFNGTLKVVKCKKTKLWGYEKNKKARDLVYRFLNGAWRDGNEHIVERLSTIQLKQGGNNLTIEVQRDDNQILEAAVDKEDEEMEMEKNSKVLASILGKFDFDKPLDYKEEVDEFGGSDYEYNKSDLESDQDDFVMDSANLKDIEYVKEGEFSKYSPQKPKVYDEDEDDDTDLYTQQTYITENFTKTQSQQSEDEKMEVDDDSEEEFIPTFGQDPEPKDKPEVKLLEGTVSNTETLRSLFTTDEPKTFNLIEEDDDIDHSIPVPEQIQLPTVSPLASIAPKKNKRALFFAHLDSPFLVAQTQLSKLEQPVNFENWDTTFWEKRAEWTQECKRRKRDVLRQMRKKNAKNSRVFV